MRTSSTTDKEASSISDIEKPLSMAVHSALTTTTGPTEHRLIPGLLTWSAPPDQIAAVAAELRGAFDNLKARGPETGSRHGRRRMSDAIELGVSFNRMEKDAPCFCMERATGSRAFSSTLGLIAEQTAAYREHIETSTGTKTTKDNDHHLNVVIRRYRPGQSIGFHIDRLEKFEDAVWNVVVENNDSTGGLQYQVDQHTKVPVTESSGLVSVQTGPARNTFKHGVPTVSSERISITWRWFRPAFLSSLADYNEAEARAVLSPFVNQVQRRLSSVQSISDKTNDGHVHSNQNQHRDRENSEDSSDSDNADSNMRSSRASAASSDHLMAMAMRPLPPAPKHDWSPFGMAAATSATSAAIKLLVSPTDSPGPNVWGQPAALTESNADAHAHNSQQPARSANSRVRARTEVNELWASRPRVGIISSSIGIIGHDTSKGKDHITRFCRALGHALSRSSRHEPTLKDLALCLAEPPSFFGALNPHSTSATPHETTSTSLPAVDTRSRAVGGAFRDGMKTPIPVVRGGAASMDPRATDTPVVKGTASVHILPTTEVSSACERFALAADVYVMIEGGFSAADMARTIMENPNAAIIRVGATGGAAAGYFDVKPEQPEAVPFTTWDLLQSTVLSNDSTDDELRRVAAEAAKAVQAVLLHHRKAKAEMDSTTNDSDAADSALVKDVVAPSPVRISRSRATSATARGTAWPRGAVHRSSSNSRSPSLTHYSTSSKESSASASCW